MTKRHEVLLAGPRWWPVVPLCLFLLFAGGWSGVASAEAVWTESDPWTEAGEAGWQAEDGKPGHAHRAQHAAVRRVRSADEAEPAQRACRCERAPEPCEWGLCAERHLVAGPARRPGPARAPPAV